MSKDKRILSKMKFLLLKRRENKPGGWVGGVGKKEQMVLKEPSNVLTNL